MFEGYIFDLDGTIYVGDRMIDKANDVIDILQKSGKKVLFLTNKTIVSRRDYVKKLNKFGIRVQDEHILSPTEVMNSYLKDNFSGAKLYVIGERIIKDELRSAGFHFAETPEKTDVVVISWDRDFHYSQLNFAYQAIKRGALAIATNPDRTCPIEDGEIPDCGGIIGAIEGATGKKIDVIVGKPAIITAQSALDILKLEANQCLMVGDRLETDILMGKRAGIHTALVLTGVTKKEDLATSSFQPDYVLSSVRDIPLMCINTASH